MNIRIWLSIFSGVAAVFLQFGFFFKDIPGPLLMFIFAVLSAFLAYTGRNAASNRDAASLVLGGSYVILMFSVFLLALDLLSKEPSSIRIISSNESAAASTVYLLAKANVAYAMSKNDYVNSLDELDQSQIPQSARNAQDVIRTGSAAGYTFTYSKRLDVGFEIVASPQILGKTGNRFFYVDKNLKVHWQMRKPADTQSPAIE